MEQGGYFSINRKIVSHWLYPKNGNRKFTKFEAWIEIIRRAHFVCTKREIQGRLIVIPRGYFETTISQLSESLNWDRRTTEKFLRTLKDEGMISMFKINPKSLKSCTLIKVNNYNKLQPPIFEGCKSSYKEKCNLNCKINKKVEMDSDIYMRLSK